MTLFVRKYFWTINLLTIALCALFGARAVGRLVEANLPAAKASRSAAPPPALEPPGPQQREISQILSRNIFCSTCEAVSETPAKAEANGGDGEPTNDVPVKTSLNLKLIATLVSDDDKAWSFAAVEDASDETTRMYAIGSKTPGDAVVTDIMDRRILLLNGNRNEFLDLDVGQALAGGVEQTPGDSPSPPVTMNAPMMPGMEEISKGIRKVGEGKYEFERSALNRVLANTTLLARSARIVPSVRNGQPNGFKLYAIRPGSLYSMLGMLNGDTINAINGHAITTPDRALEVYTKLRNASNVSISFTRRGKVTTHEYTIR